MLQQTVEIGIKQVLRELGVEYSKIHNIRNLLDKVPENNQFISEELYNELYDKADVLTEWESFSRYNDAYLPARRNVIRYLELVSKFVKELDNSFEKYDVELAKSTEVSLDTSRTALSFLS